MKNLLDEKFNEIAADIKDEIWLDLNLRRGNLAISESYYFLLILLLKRDGLLDNLVIENPKIVKRQLQEVISKIDGEIGNAYNRIFQIFEPAIELISDDVFFYLIRNYQKDNWDMVCFNQKFAEIFDDLLYKLSKSSGRQGGESILPIEISRFACNLVNIPVGATVYNPFAGEASFGVFLNRDIIYIGQEVNSRTWAIGLMRLMAHNKPHLNLFMKADSINLWVNNSEKYDLIVADPPFIGTFTYQNNTFPSYEYFLIEKGLENLKSDGNLIVFVPNSFLTGTGLEQKLRRKLIDNNQIEMIISFPGGLLMNTKIPFNIIVIKKYRKSGNDVVRFLDATNYVYNTKNQEKCLDDYRFLSQVIINIETESLRIVDVEVIKEYKYTLNVHQYFVPKLEIDSNSELLKLGEILSSLESSTRIKTGFGKFIRIRNLKDDKIEFKLDINSIEVIELLNGTRKISESCLLLAGRWNTLKPTYFEFTGESIFVSQDILVFKVDDTKIDLAYLINELHSHNVIQQAQSYRTGSVIPAIRKDDLLNIKIQVPSLAEQKAKVKGVLEALAEVKKNELVTFNKIHGLESEIIEQNTYLRHTLTGPTSNLKGSISNLKAILMNQVLPKVNNILNLKVSENHELTFGEYLQIMERDILKISNAVSRQLKVETKIASKVLTPVDIIDFTDKFIKEVNDKNNLNFTAAFDFDKVIFLEEKGLIKKPFILANEDLLTDLFNNLLDNAINHAFSNEFINRIDIFVTKNTALENENEIQILFSNTGNSFPENFMLKDFVRKGSKAGENAGDGFGGYYINDIINKLGGNFGIINKLEKERLNADFATTFEINFPIIENDEII